MVLTRKIKKSKNNQYVLTIPKAIAEILDFRNGTIIEFFLTKNFELLLKKISKQSKSTHIKLQRTSNNQNIITVPKALAEILDLSEVEISLTKDMNILLKKR